MIGVFVELPTFGGYALKTKLVKNHQNLVRITKSSSMEKYSDCYFVNFH